jgi:HAD superfamily hydrolase (TIGR01509 family)
MIPENIEAVIFDFDGVIADTEVIGVRVCSDLMKRMFQIELTEEDQNSFYGLQDKKFYQHLFEKYELSANVNDIIREHNQAYDFLISLINKPLPGLRETLQKINEESLPIAICSGSYKYQVRKVLTNLRINEYFHSITSCEETQQHKPLPDPYLLAAKKFDVDPAKCLVLEDSENGIVSAKRAGMYVIGVTIGNHGTQDLRGADKVIHTLKELFDNQ